MKRLSLSIAMSTIAITMLGLAVVARAEEGNASKGAPSAGAVVYPIAILPFEERGKEVVGQGSMCSDVLFANLVADPDVYLVEREELKKMLGELQLNAAGLTNSDQSPKIGQLTGAKILVTGSVFQTGNSIYVVAKLIGTESGRTVGASAKGKVSDDLDTIVASLANDVVAKLKKDGDKLVPAPTTLEDRLSALAAAIGKDTPRPAVYIDVSERHIGQPVIDPAIETELSRICDKLGFKVIDRQQGNKAEADILLVGSGFSQFAARHDNFTSVKARVELKAVEQKTGRTLAVDRQTAVAVDLAELVAGKAALQDATDKLASRLLPAMLKPKADAPANAQ